MSWIGTVFSWFKDEHRVITVGEHFGGPLRFGTPWGVVFVSEDYKSNLFNGVNDTDFKEFQAASVLHDLCCDLLKIDGVVCDEDGNPIISTQEQADLAFLLEMMSAIKRIVVRMLHERRPTSEITAVVTELGARALVYHRGVRWYDKLFRR